MPGYTYLFFDACAVLALITLIIALCVRRLYKGRNNQLFLLLCAALCLTGILDIATEYMDHFIILNQTNTRVRFVLTTFYFLLHNLMVPLYFLYIASVMGLWYRIKNRLTILTYLWIIPYLIDVIILAINVIYRNVFYYDERYIYRWGPWMPVLYVVAFYYAVFTTIVIIKYRHIVSTSWFWSLFSMIPPNIVAVIIQYYFPFYRIEIFMTAVMAIEVAIIVHRPEDMIDDTVGMLSYKAFMDSVRTVFDSSTPTAYLMIRVSNYRLLRRNLGMLNYMSLISDIAKHINEMCAAARISCESYYLEQGSFAVTAGIEKYERLTRTAHELNDFLNSPVKLGQMEVMLDTCICMVKCPEDISSMDSLLNFEGTYNSKLTESGRVYHLSEEMQDKSFRIRNDMDEIISRGIEGHRFLMYYQPIYNMEKGCFTTAEALIRLIDIEYGFVSPALFIPAAEESGAIHDIGDYVIDEVCRFIGSIDFERYGLEYIEINLSVAQCIETNLHEKIIQCMEKYGVRPDQINLEITETAADYAPEITDNNIEILSNEGIRFSLDDYGTGYSNVSRVVQLPLDIVKLDKSLVDDMDIPVMWTVIKKTVQMLKRMRKKVLVEGVEDMRAFERFSRIGCDYIQGFYFSKPLPEKDFLAFLKENNKAAGE